MPATLPASLRVSHTLVCESDSPFCEPPPCSLAAEAALHPLIWYFERLSSHLEGCFFQTPVFLYLRHTVRLLDKIQLCYSIKGNKCWLPYGKLKTVDVAQVRSVHTQQIGADTLCCATVCLALACFVLAAFGVVAAAA